MGIRFAVARAVSGVSSWGLKTVFRRSAGNFPGKMALYVDPALIAHLSSKLRKGSLLVVGTNGKTTVTNLIADILEKSGEEVICNRSGANLDSGIATALLQSGEADWGIFETDELWAAKVLPHLQCDYLLLLDLFHDQMDRITEIDLIQQSILSALETSPKTVLVYNADDPTCAFIAQKTGNPSLAFGLGERMQTACSLATEATLCQCCSTLLEFTMRQYGQLGDYRCPQCSFTRPKLDFIAENISLGASGLSFTLKEPLSGQNEHAAALGLEAPCNAAYMVYNLSAVAVMASMLGCPQEAIRFVVRGFSPQNGRLERYDLPKRRVLLNLAKNPVGFNQNINVIAQDPHAKIAAFFVNDKEGDGRDVSWLWNVDFESLLVESPCGCGACGADGGEGEAHENAEGKESPVPLYVFAGGMRAHDVQVRLKYAGIDAAIVKDAEDLLEKIDELPEGANAYLIGNYTALPAMKEALDKAEAEAKSQAQDSDGAEIEVFSQEPDEAEGVPAELVGERSEKASEGGFAASEGMLGRSETVFSDKDEEDRPPFDPDIEVTLRPEGEPVRIVELFGELLGLFGDNGNAIILEKRLSWRGIPVEIERVPFGRTPDFDHADLVVLGGSPAREQRYAASALLALKDQLRAYVENDGPLLAIDGSYQLFGARWFDDGEERDGLGIVDMRSASYQSFGDKEPAISPIALASSLADQPVVGFENHASRTVLGEGVQPFGTVASSRGCGNNTASKQDGVIYRNLVGTYLHGPVLSKNPSLADHLLALAIGHHAARTGEAPYELIVLNDYQERNANKHAL